MTARILIADEIPTNRIILRVKLAAARYEVLQVGLAMDVLPEAREQKPDVILLDDAIGDGGGIKLCRALKSDPVTSGIPVIMITDRSEPSVRVAALDAGADEILVKPLNDLALLARVRAILRARESAEELQRRRRIAGDFGFSDGPASFQRPGRVALVMPPEDGAALAEALRPMLADKLEIVSESNVLTPGTNANPPDIYVLAPAREADALSLLADLRARAGSRRAAILVVYPAHAQHIGVTALDMGANDLLCDGYEPAELAVRIRTQLKRKLHEDQLRDAVEDGLRLAATDPLTGLYNRRYAMARLTDVERDAQGSGRAFAVVLADLDHFKAINDTYGHAAGDAVLKEVARRLKDNLRGADLVARYGGEEFLMVLPETDLDRAEPLARRLCALIGQTPFALPGRKAPIPVTMSIGVAVGGSDKNRARETLEALIERADTALYGAKAHGRNQVTVAAA